MAAQSHTPFWRNDHHPAAASTTTSAGAAGGHVAGPATTGATARPSSAEGAAGSSAEVAGLNPLGYVFGWDERDLPGNSLLDSSENALMKTFFEDPNNFTAYDFRMEQKETSAPNSGFDPQANPSRNAFNLNYFSPTHGRTYNNPQSQPGRRHGGADVSAASSLMNMSSQHHAPPMANGNSWAPNVSSSTVGVMIPADETRNDLDPSSRPPNALNNGVFSRPMAYTPELLSARLGMPDSGFDPTASAAPQTAQQHAYNLGWQDYPTSLNHEGNPQVALTSRQLPYAFGSDADFSSQGYQGMGSSLQRDKVYNLLNVPLAHQAAGHDPRRQVNTTNYPGQPGGTSSPGALHANQLSSPSGLANPGLGQWIPNKRRHTEYMGGVEDEEGNDDDRQSLQQRKRHKSTEGDGEGYHAKRGSRMSRSGDFDGDFSSAIPINRPPSGHQNSTPGSAVSSPGAEGSSSKKKNRDNKARPNLTESQKRENHIISEQKRRNVIKQAFNDLNQMVPNLQKGKSGLSKAEILKEVVSFIEATVHGNKCMEELLDSGDGIHPIHSPAGMGPY